MLFNTIDFVIFFIIVLTTLTVIKKRRFQHLFLLIASYFFFYYSSNYLIVLLLITTIWDFYFGEIIYNAKTVKTKKLALVTSLAGNLGLLGFFKYADFAITQFNFLGSYFELEHIPHLNLALPIAISFYTFHSITYTVSIYRGQLRPVKSFTDYAIFVAFFPQLVAGPILRAKEFLPQLREKLDVEVGIRLRQIIIHNQNLKYGITMMALGFFKKMFFADNISPFVNEVFANPLGLDSFAIVLATIGFGIQIYCDFSGYSDIAIGAALIMGFKIPINFNKPYFATSPADFWRRWHISLSTWLRDYLYIPLGGNKKSKLRTYLNLMIVMFLGGLWHGAAWNFVLWGILHGVYLACHRFIVNKFPHLTSNQFFKSNLGKIITILITQYLVFLAWIPFRIENTQHMLYTMQKFVILDIHTHEITSFILSHKLPVLFMMLFVILHIYSYKKNILDRFASLHLHWWTIFLLVIMLLIIFFYDGNPEDFVYFRF
ncbi:MAG: MBOAT family O-acyltransferase [Nitrososphaera sp.]|jgi:alginate O-acetyltransferase complex protein AlgI